MANPTTDDLNCNITGGSVASGAADSGNPVKVGGKYNATKPSLVDGQRGDLQLCQRGNLRVTLGTDGGTGTTQCGSPGDAAAGNAALFTWSQNAQYNGATFDRVRGNQDLTLLASAARTATTSSADQTNYNGRGVQVVFDVTAVSGTPSLVLTISAKDVLSGKYVTLLTGAAVVATGTALYTIYPGINIMNVGSVSNGLPRTWRITVTPGTADSCTYSVGASQLV